MSYLIIGLKGATKKNRWTDGQKVFFYTSKRGIILKETFEKEVSNKLAPKI